MYYKAHKSDGTICDALDGLQCVRYFERIGILRCRENDHPEGIISTNGEYIWQVDGWPAFPEAAGWDGDTVTLTEIAREEYEAIREAIDEGEEYIEPEPEPEPDDPYDLEYVRTKKVSAMAAACEAAIEAGFSVAGEDGAEHHYSLAVTDQIMLSQLALKAQAGETVIPWHADGEPCRFYTPQEMLALNAKMEELITFQQTYFNSLKMYINSMGTIAEIGKVTYGMGIPEEYQSEVLKALLAEASA